MRVHALQRPDQRHVLKPRPDRQPAGLAIVAGSHRQARAEVLEVPRPGVGRSGSDARLELSGQEAIRHVAQVRAACGGVACGQVGRVDEDAPADHIDPARHLGQRRGDPGRRDARVGVGRGDDAALATQQREAPGRLVHQQPARVADVRVRLGQIALDDVQPEVRIAPRVPPGNLCRVIAAVVDQQDDLEDGRIERRAGQVALPGQRLQRSGQQLGLVTRRDNDRHRAARRRRGVQQRVRLTWRDMRYVPYLVVHCHAIEPSANRQHRIRTASREGSRTALDTIVRGYARPVPDDSGSRLRDAHCYCGRMAIRPYLLPHG
jgi:hypothetical protein